MGDQEFRRNGMLHILGRVSDTITGPGGKVYPHQVELALESVPAISAAMVVSHGQGPDRVVAGVLPACGTLTATRIRMALQDLLDPIQKPQGFYQLNELPLT